MNQAERRKFLLEELLWEDPACRRQSIPADEETQKLLLRGLLNIRPPRPIGEDFLKVQDEYLQAAIAEKGITDFRDLTPLQKNIYLWQGDITTLKCDAIVNAANSGMTGCYCPCHGCIDNAIHTYAGIELRLECAEIMKKQGYHEPVGRAKITKAYNLPSQYVIHTVGPYISGKVTAENEEQLAACYRSCLQLADRNHLQSIAFCCISTGEFNFPNQRAAEIALATVRKYQEQTNSGIEVIFNVYKTTDYEIYRELLG